MKKLLILFLIFILIACGAYFLLSQKTAHTETNHKEQVEAFESNSAPQNTISPAQTQCLTNNDFNVAYKVNIDISAHANHTQLYHSTLSFNVQFEKSDHSDKVKLYIKDALFLENQLNKVLQNTIFSAQISHTPYLSFVAFDTLSMPPKHPLQSTSQLLKALSIGQEGKPNTFKYDQLSKVYTYTHHATSPTRNTLPKNKQGSDDWHITLDKQCLPITLHSKESQAINFAGGDNTLNYEINAERIPNFISLADIPLDNQANANHFWTPQDINSKEFAKPVTSLEEMLDLLDTYNEHKSSAKLARGADFIINNLSPLQMSELMLSTELSEDQKRLLAYSMSLTDNPNTENFMLETISNMPTNQGEQTDVQTMRLMVSISSYDNITQQSYDAMQAINSNAEHSSNIRNNALISMGTMINTLDESQSSGLSHSFNQFIEQKMDSSEEGRSAILAAGNAKLNSASINQKIINNLNSSDEGRRYASASVLARHEENYDKLINKLASEQSLFVINAIVNNIDKNKLSTFQQQKIREIASKTNPSSDKYKLLNTLYK